jgi:predicted PurR-regulated permease PerM
LTILICLFAALCVSLARFEPDFPRYLDHIQANPSSRPEKFTIDRPPGRLVESGQHPSGKHPGASFVDMALKNAPKVLAILVIVHVLAFFLLLYGARLLKKLVDMIPGVSEKQNVVEIASEIEQTAARYFTSVTLINSGLGVSVWISVGVLGLPHPLLWGVAAFLLHYIPFVGATGGIVAIGTCFTDSF